MELKFIGSGSCFNTMYGNTSAVLPVGDTVLLFDCGESIFDRIKRGDLLNGFKSVNIFISHSHSDHCGSLSSLLFYLHYILKVKSKVFAPKAVFQILDLQGTFKEIYERNELATTQKLEIETNLMGLNGIRKVYVFPVKTQHSPLLESYGFVVSNSVDAECFYYSGDAKTVSPVVLTLFRKNTIKRIYQDCSWSEYPDSIHMSYKELCNTFDKNERSRVTLMHLEEGFNFNQAETDGWSFPKC